jgi:putative transposase
MRETGMVAIYPGPNLSRRQHKEQGFPYLLRNLTVRAPNHVWGIDMTYIRMQKRWMYLVAVLDWFSRYVISWELDHTLEMPLVIEACQRALSIATPIIWNSDQGSHFTSPQYQQLLRDAHVQISMDSKGRALDAIFTERLWRTVKYEEVSMHDYASPKEARQHLNNYFKFDNHERLHQALDDHTPAEVYSTGASMVSL